MKRILICCDYMAPYEGNFISSVKALEASLRKRYEIVYMFPMGNNPDFIEWFDAFCRTRKVLTYRPLDYNFVKKECSKDYDLIYLHFYSMNFARTLSAINPDKKIVLHGHHKPILKRWRAVIEYLKSLGKRYKNLYVISCSRGVQKAYSLMVKPSHVYLSANCIDFNRIDRLAEISKKQKNNKDFVISMYGGEMFTKGVDIACKAIQKINNKKIKLQIYCSHNLEENTKELRTYFPDCNAQILSYCINPCDVYLNSDIFIAPSRFEGFNYSILECIYCGTPVIASNLKEHRHRDCPYLFFKNKRSDSLAKSILKIFNGDKVTIDKDKIREEHDIKNWVLRTSKIIDSIFEDTK